MTYVTIPTVAYLELLTGLRGFRTLCREEREILDTQIFKGELRAIGYVLSNDLMSAGHGSLWTRSDWDMSELKWLREKAYSAKQRKLALNREEIEKLVMEKLRTCTMLAVMGDGLLKPLAKDIIAKGQTQLVFSETVIQFEEIYERFKGE